MSRNWKLAIAAGLVTLAGTVAAQAAENADEVLIKALAGAKITLLQGIAQVAKGTEGQFLQRVRWRCDRSGLDARQGGVR